MSSQMLPMSLLQSHPRNRRIDSEHVTDLAESMAKSGQWDAIRVRPLPGGQYQITAGHHRVEAAHTLGWTEIMAEVVSLTDEEADAFILDSNLRRKAMSEMDEAEALRYMVDAYGWSQRQIAQRFNRTQPWVVYRLRLVELAPEVKEAVINRFINPTSAAHIAQAPIEMQGAIAQKVQKADLSTRETERLARIVTNPETPADVRRAVLEDPKFSPEAAEIIAKAPSAFQREGLIRDAAHGRMTPEEAEREVRVAIRQAGAPRSVQSVRAQRHLNVTGHLTKAKDLLEEITGEDIGGLDHGALSIVEGIVGSLGTRLNRLNSWVIAANQQHRGKTRDGKVVDFPGAR